MHKPDNMTFLQFNFLLLKQACLRTTRIRKKLGKNSPSKITQCLKG